MTFDLESDATVDPGLSRRTVLRGAGAAWAASAITLATAVPAVAASGPPNFGAAAVTQNPTPKSNPYNPSVSFTNTGGAGTAHLRVTELAIAAGIKVAAPGWTSITTNFATTVHLVSNAPIPTGPTTVLLTITKANNSGTQNPNITASVGTS